MPIASMQSVGDWGESMLAGGKVGIGMFPAKFTWDVTAAPSCANDYVAFNTSLAGAADTVAAKQTATFPNANNTPAGTITITNGTASLVLTAAANNTGNNFQVGNNTAPGNTTNATSLAARIVALGAPVGVTATSAAGVVTITATATGGDGNLITLATTIAAALFTLGGATLAGGVGTANIIAFNQLYSTQGSVGGFCTQNGPSVDWSYFTGTGTAVTSIVLSFDGTKVALVENDGTNATLRILRWQAGEGTTAGKPVAPANKLAAGQNWTTCPAGSCMSSIAFSGGPATDTISEPFYNYPTDALYVGDNSGRVHKFTGVFLGAPAEVLVSWPITVNAGATLTSPIYDGVSGNIFVGDSTGRLSFIQEVGSTVGGATPCSPFPCLNPVNLAVGTAGAIVDGPVVDPTNGTVFAFNGTETSANRGTILQASTGLTGSVSFKIGGNGAGSAIYSGAFDNTYINSAKGTTAGHMYVCGKSTASRDRPGIYQLSFTAAGVLSSVGTALINLVSASGEACSPVTEFNNPNGAGAGVARDWIFFSIGNRSNNGGTTTLPAGSACRTDLAGCVISINVTGNPAWPPATVTNTAPVPANATGSTSGIVVDNTSVSAQASSFYFTLGANSTGAGPGVPSCNTTAGTGCAVKLTQAGLN
jgi:hypothetical protein